MDGQKTAHWQTLDFLCVNVCHLTPFVTISGVKESRLPVSQVVYSMMKWSSADQKIVPLCNCQLFIFFLAGLAFWSFFLCMLRLSFAFSSMPLKQNKTKQGWCLLVVVFSPQRNHWYVVVLQLHFYILLSPLLIQIWYTGALTLGVFKTRDCSTLTNFVLFSCMKSQQIAVHLTN